MALGRQEAVQEELLIGWHEVPVAPGHVFYDRLNGLLDEAGFDLEVEALCTAHYASGVGRPGVPPGRYFRMLFVGYFEGLESERGIAWRCADSLSLRRFLKLGTSEAVPDHSTLSRTRARLPLELHDAVFALVLRLVAEHGLVKGRRVGVDASTMEANAAMRSIVRRADGVGWQAMLGELARTSGIATPTADQLRQFDRSRTGKRVANADWASPSDPEARITRLKDGRTRLAYKPLTGAILAAEVQHDAEVASPLAHLFQCATAVAQQVDERHALGIEELERKPHPLGWVLDAGKGVGYIAEQSSLLRSLPLWSRSAMPICASASFASPLPSRPRPRRVKRCSPCPASAARPRKPSRRSAAPAAPRRRRRSCRRSCRCIRGRDRAVDQRSEAADRRNPDQRATKGADAGAQQLRLAAEPLQPARGASRPRSRCASGSARRSGRPKPARP